MQSLEEACEEADHLMNLAKKRPSSIPLLQFKNGPAFFSIQNRLRSLYYEECSKPLPIRDLKATSLLLEKLVAKENLNTLVVNLYPGNKGYSLAIRQTGKGTNEKLTETVRWPYQMDTFLSYLDNGELPFMLVDLLEETYPEVFYSGCIIAEVRDYRQSYPHFSCNTHHILLQPTTQSVISDVNLLAAQSDLSSEEKVLLESELVLATQGPLCLDPSPSMVFLHATAQHQRNLLSTEPLRRCARKFSQVSVNRKRKLDQFTSQPHLPLLDVISRRKGRIGSQTGRLHKKSLDNISLEVPQIPVTRPLEMVPPPLTPPPEGSVDVARFARAGEWPREISDCTPQLVEEYILEADRGTGQIYHIKISLLQRVSNLEYIGELYVDKDYREGEKNGRTCRFPLGSRLQANHYIQQFSEIFTEEGRKSVRITHIVPGQPPRVSCTPGMRERDAKAQAQAKALARSTLAAVTSTTNINVPNVRIPSVNSSQTNNSLSNSVKNTSDLVTVTNASSSSSTNPPTAASSNVNLVNALTSPPIASGFTNILTSGLLSVSQPPAVHAVNNLQSVNQVQTSTVESSQPQQLQLKQPVIQQQSSAQTQPQIQAQQQGSPQAPQQQTQPQAQPQPTQLRSQLETPSKIGGRTITNPEISALVTSLMNSAQQFQQQQQQQQQQQLQRQLQQQSAVKSPGVTSTVGAVTTTKTVPNTLLNLLNSGVGSVSTGTGTGTQKVRKMSLSHLLNAKVLTPAQQQQLQQQFLQQQQQQRVTLPTLSAQLSSPPANESVLQHSLSSHPQVRFSSPNRVTLPQPVQQQIQQPPSSIMPSFEVEVPSASGSATVNVNVAVPQFDVLDSETNAANQVSSGGTVSSTSTAVPLYDITPSNFNTLVTNFNSSAVQNFDSTVTVNTLTSPNSSISVNNSAANFDLQSLVDSALVSDSTTTSVPNFEISVSNAGSIPNFEIRVPTLDDSVSNSSALTSDLSGQVAANFEIPIPNSTNDSANGDILNQQSSGTASYQISFPDLNSYENSNTLTVHNNFDFTAATSYTTVPVNTKTVAVSSNASGTNSTSVSGSNLLGRILAGGTASAAIRRLSANAAVASAASNNDNASNAHGLTALSALLAGTPSADNPIPGTSSSLSGSSLLERLTASSSAAPPPLQFATPSPSPSPSKPVASVNSPAPSPATPKSPAVAVASPMSSPPSQAPSQGQQGLTVSGVNLQGLNLASLQGAIGTIPGLQNVQVSFPGMSSPISLSLSVSSAAPHIASAAVVSSGGTTGTVCGSAVSSSPHTMVLINPPLSVPVAQLMSGGVKAVGAQAGLRGIAANSIQIPQGSGQAIQLVGTLQRAKSGGQVTKANVLAGRQLQATVLSGAQRKIPTANAGTAQMAAPNQVFLAQQQLHLIQKGVPYTQYQLQQQPQQQQQQQQPQQQIQQKSGVLAAQLTSKRRRSNAADGTTNK